jgi:hypothetical protein
VVIATVFEAIFIFDENLGRMSYPLFPPENQRCSFFACSARNLIANLQKPTSASNVYLVYRGFVEIVGVGVIAKVQPRF